MATGDIYPDTGKHYTSAGEDISQELQELRTKVAELESFIERMEKLVSGSLVRWPNGVPVCQPEFDEMLETLTKAKKLLGKLPD